VAVVLAGQYQAGQAEVGGRLLDDPGHRGGNLAVSARFWPGDPAVRDPPADGEGKQAADPVRRLGLGARINLRVVDPQLCPQRHLPGDDEFLAQVHGAAGDDRDKLACREPGKELVAEVLPELVFAWCCPPRLAGVPEPGDHPPDLRQDTAFGAALGVDEAAEGRPARQAVLGGDGPLGLVQGGELTGPQPPPGLQLEVPQVRMGRQ
jgi:hypothetical protein